MGKKNLDPRQPGRETKTGFDRFKKQFRNLFSHNPDPVFLLDMNGNFIAVNKSAAKITEGSQKELLGKNFSYFCEPKDLDCIQKHFRDAQNGSSYNFDIAINTLKGNRRFLNITNMPLLIDGEIQGIYGIARNVTQQKILQQEVKLSHRISKIFNSTSFLKKCLYLSLKEICEFSEATLAEAWLGWGNIFHPSVHYFAETDQQTLRDKDEFHLKNGLIKMAVRKRGPVLIDDIQKDPVYFKHKLIQQYGIKSAIAYPIISSKETIAVLIFYFRNPPLDIKFYGITENLISQLAGYIERKKTEEELSKFFSLSTHILCVLNKQGYFNQLNRAFARLLGYSNQMVISKRFDAFIHPDDRKLIMQKILKLTEFSQTVQFQSRYITKAGEVKWVAWSLSSTASEGYIYGVGRDITESMRMEKIILGERQRFLEMFSEAPVTMAILKGPDHIFEQANDFYYRFSGRKNILGKSVRAVFPEAQGQGIFELMDKVYLTGETYVMNERHLQLDVQGEGKLEDLYLSFMFQPYRNEEGEVEGIFYFGVDVTEQVKARQRVEVSKKQYTDLIQNLPAAVYTCDAKGFILLYNKAAANLWGRVPELGKEKWCGSWKIYNEKGEEIPHELSPMAIALQTKTPLIRKELKIKSPDGKIKHIVSFPSPVFDADGKLSGGMNVLIDITERKRAEEELLKAENQVRTFARQLNYMLEEERRRIGREIHDEFGQQLMGLKMSLSSLKSLSTTDTRTRAVVSDLTDDLEKSINALRKISTELRPGILDTLGLIPSIEWLGAEFSKRTGIKCNLKTTGKGFKPDGNISITLFRVCQEALTNISKHAQATEVNIEVTQSSTLLSMKISDNGKGIQLENLNNPFSLGLLGMRERANFIGADLKISRNNFSGTDVHLILERND